jgi:hypothetical protein
MRTNDSATGVCRSRRHAAQLVTVAFLLGACGSTAVTNADTAPGRQARIEASLRRGSVRVYELGGATASEVTCLDNSALEEFAKVMAYLDSIEKQEGDFDRPTDIFQTNPILRCINADRKFALERAALYSIFIDGGSSQAIAACISGAVDSSTASQFFGSSFIDSGRRPEVVISMRRLAGGCAGADQVDTVVSKGFDSWQSGQYDER